MPFVIKSISEFLSLALEEAKATLILSFFVSYEEKDRIIVFFSIGQLGFDSRSF